MHPRISGEGLARCDDAWPCLTLVCSAPYTVQAHYDPLPFSGEAPSPADVAVIKMWYLECTSAPLISLSDLGMYLLRIASFLQSIHVNEVLGRAPGFGDHIYYDHPLSVSEIPISILLGSIACFLLKSGSYSSHKRTATGL